MIQLNWQRQVSTDPVVPTITVAERREHHTTRKSATYSFCGFFIDFRNLTNCFEVGYVTEDCNMAVTCPNIKLNIKMLHGYFFNFY